MQAGNGKFSTGRRESGTGEVGSAYLIMVVGFTSYFPSFPLNNYLSMRVYENAILSSWKIPLLESRKARGKKRRKCGFYWEIEGFWKVIC